jgi:hypothetical protein
VKWRQVYAVIYSAENVISDQYRVRESLAAMYHSMADGVHVCNTLDIGDSRIFHAGPVNDPFNGRSRIANRRSRSMRYAPCCMKSYDRLATYSLHCPTSQFAI